MMGWMPIAALAMQVGPQLPDRPAVPAETLVASMPAGFTVGYRAAQAGQTIEERVPAGETVEAWTRMVTVQRFGGAAPLGAHGLLDRLDGLMVQACPGAIAGEIADDTQDGRVVAAVRIDCPRNSATGKPETMFARAVQGAADIHLVQYAYRSVPTAAEATAATAYLAAVRLCPGTDAACSAPAR